jgi:hypothetical protein
MKKAKELIAAGLQDLSFDLVQGKNSLFSTGQEMDPRHQKRAFMLKLEDT